jgi:hypothetical protein
MNCPTCKKTSNNDCLCIKNVVGKGDNTLVLTGSLVGTTSKIIHISGRVPLRANSVNVPSPVSLGYNFRPYNPTLDGGTGKKPVTVEVGSNGDIVFAVSAADLVAGSETPLIVTDTSTINFTTSGTSNHNLTGVVKLSLQANNLIQVNADGLYVNSGLQTPLTVVDSNTIDLTTSGTDQHTLSALVKISTQSNNALSVAVDGLYVNALSFTETILNAVDSSTLDFTTSGTAGHTLTGLVKVSPNANNALQSVSNGLYVPVASAGVQTPITGNTSNSIQLLASGTDNHTLTANVKISATGGNILSTNADGIYASSPAFTETPLTVTDSSSIDFTGTGTSNHNLTGVVKISSNAGNILSVTPTGLFASSSAVAETVFTANDSSSIDFTVSGTANHTLTGAVKISTTAGNSIVLNADGIYAPNSGGGGSVTLDPAGCLTTTGSGLALNLTNPSAAVTPGQTLTPSNLVNIKKLYVTKQGCEIVAYDEMQQDQIGFSWDFGTALTGERSPDFNEPSLAANQKYLTVANASPFTGVRIISIRGQLHGTSLVPMQFNIVNVTSGSTIGTISFPAGSSSYATGTISITGTIPTPVKMACDCITGDANVGVEILLFNVNV